MALKEARSNRYYLVLANANASPDGMPVVVVTKEELTQAMQEKMEWNSEQASAKAELLLEVFGFDTQVIDNVLEPEDRQLFYHLQETGILTTRSEENVLWNGQEWRTHYWIVRTQRVHELAATFRLRDPVRAAYGETETVYTGLPESVWERIRPDATH
ncbi:MAG: DUF6015 family protein [Thermoplasmatota archaeon]